MSGEIPGEAFTVRVTVLWPSGRARAFVLAVPGKQEILVPIADGVLFKGSTVGPVGRPRSLAQVAAVADPEPAMNERHRGRPLCGELGTFRSEPISCRLIDPDHAVHFWWNRNGNKKRWRRR